MTTGYAVLSIVALLGGATLFVPGAEAASPPAVKNIVLVHGAWADGSGWNGVYRTLVKNGYRVSVVSLPESSLSDDVKATQRVLDAQDGPVVLVGHSYGGVVITEAGNDPKVQGLVYVAAFVLDKGESIEALSKSAPPGSPAPPVLPPRDGYLYLDAAKFLTDFAGDLPAAEAEFMAASQVPLSLTSFGDAVSTEPAWKSKPSWAIVARQDKTIGPVAETFMARRAGADITEMDGSHLVYVSRPAEVAAVIEKAATSLGAQAASK
jgi:pimeloyl-ACP methyl ester carboxylesterase